MAISVEVDARAAIAALGHLASSLRDRSAPNRQLGTQLYSWVIRDYDGRGNLRPDGPWAPLAPSTVKQKIRLGYRPEPLAPRSGNLRASFLPFSDNEQAGVGARASYGVDYAQVHEEGSGRVPRRSMLPTADIALGYATRVYRLFISGAQKDAGL